MAHIKFEQGLYHVDCRYALDVPYGPYERNRLDIWLPKAGAPTPLVIFPRRWVQDP